MQDVLFYGWTLHRNSTYHISIFPHCLELEDGDLLPWVDEVTTYPQMKDPVKRSPRTLFVLKRSNNSVAFRPDIDGKTADGRRLFAEIRTLYGHPNHSVVDGLLEIEIRNHPVPLV